MRKSTIQVLCVVAMSVLPAAAKAQCCPGYSLATACSGVTLTKSRWCIEDTVPTGQAALTTEFCAYGDKVIGTLEEVFNIPAPEVFEFQLDAQTGGAHTGTSCNHLGDGVAYDGFSGSAYGAKGFWGYLLALHEAINDWTGMSSPGWPTDWWADHQSAFPNLMDFHVMDKIGVENNDQNLIKAAAAQKKRFYPGGDSADPKVVALDNVFAAMPNGDGYAGFSQMFKLQSADGVRWDNLGVPNPDVKRSEYVVAYMSLAARQNVLSILQGPGANGGGAICNNTPDGTANDKPYTCDAVHIETIATAHCAIAANGKPQADLMKLKGGNYTNIPSGPCGATCPVECGCDASDHCVASWLGANGAAGAGGQGGSGGRAANAGAGGASAGAGGRAGVAGRGGAGRGGAGGAGGNAGAASAGRSGSGGAAAVSGSAGNPSGSGGASGASVVADGGTDADRDDEGCGCRTLSARTGGSPTSLWLLVIALAACVVRVRSRKR